MNTAVVITTCYKYREAWDPFFVLLNEYWSDCPYPIYMITDKGSYNNIKTVTLPYDLGFSGNLIHGLNNIKESNIIYFHEDFLPIKKFNNKKILELVKIFNENKFACLRLYPCPKPTISWSKNPELGILQKGDPYRISCQTAIWSKSFLKKFLIPGETGWAFEINGTIRSNNYNEEFVSVWKTPTPYFCTAIVKGKWLPEAVDFVKKKGFVIKNKIIK